MTDREKLAYIKAKLEDVRSILDKNDRFPIMYDMIQEALTAIDSPGPKPEFSYTDPRILRGM